MTIFKMEIYMKRVLVASILYLLFSLWVLCGCVSVIGIHFKLFDKFYIDGDDFAPLFNLGVFVVGGVAGFIAELGMYLITAIGALLIALVSRFIILKKEKTEGKYIRLGMTAICLISGLAYMSGCVLTGFRSLFFMLITFGWIPLLYYLIIYLSLENNNPGIVEFIEPEHNFNDRQ